MDFIPLFGFVFADLSPTSAEKRYYKNFYLDYTHKTAKQGSPAQGIRGTDGKKRRIRGGVRLYSCEVSVTDQPFSLRKSLNGESLLMKVS